MNLSRRRQLPGNVDNRPCTRIWLKTRSFSLRQTVEILLLHIQTMKFIECMCVSVFYDKTLLLCISRGLCGLLFARHMVKR